MRDVMIALQLSAVIPILIILIYKPKLNLFFKLLFASILLSAFFDIIGTVGAYLFHNNIQILCVYYLCNTLLITYMWKSIPLYPKNIKLLVKTTGFVVLALMLISIYYFKASNDAYYIIASLNVFIGVAFPLLFYYQKIAHTSHSAPLSDPYFFSASGYILFSLSTVIILTGQIQTAGGPFMVYAWVFRQLLYLVYNLIIGYAFYILYLSQTKIE